MRKVSVIIPVFNSRDSLLRAVNSVVIDPLVAEVILVDDGSSDGSYELCLDLAHKHERIFVLQHTFRKNLGASASRNLGLRQAQSDWIQFLDADDELLPGKLEKQLAIVHDEISFVVGNAIDCFEDGHIHFRKFIKDPWAGLIAGKLGNTCANLWNKKKLMKVSGWTETLSSSQEYDLMFRLLKDNSKIGFCKEFLTKVYHTPNSITRGSSRKAELIKNWVDLRLRIRDYLIVSNKFGLMYNFYWSGTVGNYVSDG